MELYKKMLKPKDTKWLNEKEYKCVSLQAISSEAIKENNKKRLREFIEEINGHLSELRTFQEKEPDNLKCAKLIETFEECLCKIVNRFENVLAPISSQLQEFQHLTNVAIRDMNFEEMQKLSERMERNLAILMEIPEVKNARNSQRADEKILEVVNTYSMVLNKLNDHLRSLKANSVEVKPKPIEDKLSPLKQKNTVGLNEVEEKLKLMRQKRLSRLSTFVDEQSKLSEQRSGEISTTNDSEPVDTIIKPSMFRMAKIERPMFKTIPEQNSIENDNVEPVKLKNAQIELPVSKREVVGQQKESIIKSFAERQIENARNHTERSNSTKSPKQIRKILNACMPKADKSIDELPTEYNSHFEQELKTFQLKSTGRFNQLDITEEGPTKKEKPIPAVRHIKPLVDIKTVERSSSQSKVDVLLKEKTLINDSRKNRQSLNIDSMIIPEVDIITIKRESHSEPPTDRPVLSSFRTSSEINNSVENPLYDIVLPAQPIIKPEQLNLEYLTLSKKKLWKSVNTLSILETEISKLESIIRVYRGLKRDDDYVMLDRALSKQYVKLNEILVETDLEQMEKEKLIDRLTKAHGQLKQRVETNEQIMRNIFAEQVEIIGRKGGIMI